MTIKRLFSSRLRFASTCRSVAPSLSSATTILLMGVALSAVVQAHAAQNEWVWMGGSSTVTPPGNSGQPGVYGTLGTPTAGNIPGSRSLASTWTDSSGNLWVFGGNVVDQYGAGAALNDLWKFNPATNEWAWMSGSNADPSSGNSQAVYGMLGTPAAGNTPGGRYSTATWIDKSGNLWLFGGFGTSEYAYLTGYLNDLWEFNPSTGLWAWMGGTDTFNQFGSGPGTYGTLGTPAASNLPGAREGATTWVDSNGNFWLFGGYGYDGNGTLGWLNDVWEFNPSTNEWTWMNGSSTFGAGHCFAAPTETLCGVPGVYGTLGTPAAGNTPGGNQYGSGWTDSGGHFWVFGGYGTDSMGLFGALNNLWEFNPTANQWTWQGGSVNAANDGGQAGVYGTLGTFAASNLPGGRQGAASWTDSSGNFWLFGGSGLDSSGTPGSLNDLWEFSPSKGYWAWIGGSNLLGAIGGQPGVYGTLGTAAAGNVPGGRQYVASFTDKSGNFWLFGGQGFDSIDTPGWLNDVWEYQPPTSALPTAATPTFSVAAGTYSTAQSVTISDTTSDTTIYYTTNETTPTAGSSVYDGAINVSSTETLEAIATASGYTTSAVATVAYTINLPAVTLSQTAALTFVSSAGTTSAPQTFTVTNSGTANLSITGITITGSTNPNVFAQTSNCPSTLAPSALCTVSVTYTPTGQENDAAYVTIADNAITSPQTLEVLGIGEAAAGPGLTISPAGQLRFSALAGATSATQTITITSTGNINLSINSVSIIGTNPADFAQTNNCGTSIAATGLCQISVTFTPAAAQSYGASVSIADNATGSPQSVGLSGTGSATPLATQTQLSSSVNSVTLGTSVNLTATVTETAGNSIPSGTVTFYDGTTSLGTSLLYNNGTAPFITNALAVGTHSITATYGGDTNNAGSTSAAVVVTVNVAAAGSGEWTWIGGNQGFTQGFNYEAPPVPGTSPVYGTQGTPSTANLPGNRYGASTWTDSNGNLWLLGGYGYDSTGTSGNLNDLWEYSLTAKTWTWVGGSNVVGANDSQFGVYGTLGTAAPGNMPGGREYAAAWTDNSGRLWLFGGSGSGAGPNVSDFGFLNDLWMYNPSTNLWTWEGGATNPSTVPYTEVPGVYGTQGIPSTSNIPGARYLASFAVDSRGNFWLFGGAGGDSAGNQAGLNDLWMFNPSTGAWTWVSGSSVVPAAATNPGSGTPGVYGTKGTASSGSVPGSRADSAAWMDQSGNLWLFGGGGEDSIGRSGYLNDLWEFNAVNDEWTWVGGSNTVPASGGSPGVYGTEGSASATNMPGSRYYTASAWTDTQGNLWLFGGQGFDSAGNFGSLNDLWTYSPSANEWTWMDGSNLRSQYGSYGTLGVASPSNTPGYRNSAAAWTNKSSNFWLYGGGTQGASNGSFYYYSDLWEYQSSAATTPVLTTPTVTVAPGSSSITTVQSLNVTIGVSGTPTPTGSVTLSSGSYTSTATALVSGSAMITVPAGSLATSTDTLTATYTPDSSSSSTYNSATGTNTVTVTTPAKTTPTVTVTPSSTSITTAQSLPVTIGVSGGSGNPPPSGFVTLSSGSYTSPTIFPIQLTSNDFNATFTVPAGSLAMGMDTLTVTYTPDSSSSSTYNSATGSNTVTVTAPSYGPGEWTWESGSSTVPGANEGRPGVYGTLGTPAAGNVPGGRSCASTWTDRNGNFWLFGGGGSDANGNNGYLNDLWEFNPSTNEWAWMGGSSTVPGVNEGRPGVYGTLGTPAAGNVPGGRECASTWTDSHGNLWLFGGGSLDANGDSDYLNDLWMFSPSTNEWAWMSGSSIANQFSGVYGTLGTPAAGNIPGARTEAAAWTDSSGNFWLFGGANVDVAISTLGSLNDLWEFNPSTNQWTWVSGSSTQDNFGGQPGVYGTLGTAAAGNVPGSNHGAAAWTDNSGNLWLFGGFGTDAVAGTVGYLNVLWEFNPSTKKWAWMGGSSTGYYQAGMYGTLGTPAAGNIPGGRGGSTAWTDSSGNFWLFGGYGFDSVDNESYLDDLWEFNPSTNKWAWMAGYNTGNQSGVYGTLGTPAAGNIPGGRYFASGWTDSSGNFWLFGGIGYDANGNNGYLNDLLRYQIPAATPPAETTPTVTVSPSPSSITTTQADSVTVTVSGGGSNPTPTGSVTLSGGTYTSAATTLVSGSAMITVPAGSLATSTDTLTATYTPDSASSSTYNGATGSNTVTVTAASLTAQTITFTQPATPVTWSSGLTIPLVATGGASGNPVVFTIDGSSTGAGSISGSTLTATAVGSFVIDANQAGNSNYSAAPQVQRTVVVSQASQTINFTQPTMPVTYSSGLTIPLVATGGASGNPVTFTIDGSSTGAGSISGSTLTVTSTGTFVIDANQAGNTNYSAATQVQRTVVVSALIAQAINFTQPTTPVTWSSGLTIPLVATGGASGDPVVFSIDGSSTGTGSISGSTLNVTTPGAFVIDANQAGNSTYSAAPQAQRTVVVNQASQTITFTQPTTPVTYSGTSVIVPLSATGGASGYPAVFTIDGSSTGTGSISGSTLTITSVGNFVIDANQAGNTDYSAATQVQRTVVASAPGAQAINFTQPTSPVTYSSGLTIPLVATGGASGNPVVFTIDGSGTGTGSISGSTLNVTTVGTFVIDANQAGNSTYSASPQVQRTVVVTQAPQAINFTQPTSPVTYSSGLQITLSATGGASGNAVVFTIDSSSTATGTVSGSTLTVTGAGNLVIDANQAGNADYSAAPQVQRTVVVNVPAPDFSVASTTSSQSVAPGGSAVYPITVTDVGSAFTGAVTLSVSGLPTGATGTFNPAPVTPGSSSASSTLTVTIPNTANLVRPNLWPMATPVLAVLFMLPFRRWRKVWKGRLLLLVAGLASLACAASLTGCGGGFGFIQSQTYTLTITGTSGTETHSTTVQLTVQQ